MGLLPGYQQPQAHPFLYPHLTNSNAVNYPICNQFPQHQQQPTTTAATATNGTGEVGSGNAAVLGQDSSLQMENKHSEDFPRPPKELEC
ncbi:unnamed protein product [Hydatigera taeniaeformis]|uniref:Uncharacterized protein n=1 Tax=Hydatigena taeniaeformis TaxID=6205 RepID=A0A0R3X127_HYDTA|nr:unnamed protein product [Hydatigera taeniaeformis]